MSDIPTARRILLHAVNGRRHTKVQIKSLIRQALLRMKREPWASHARGKPHPKITFAAGRKIKKMLKSGYTQAEVASAMGYRNSGRISEWLHRKHK